MNKPIFDFSHIAFNKLTRLSLNFAGISNGQSLAFLDMPNLEQFSLSENSITNCSFLAKIDFKKLKSFFLEHNRIISINSKLGRLMVPDDFEMLQVISPAYLYNDDSHFPV